MSSTQRNLRHSEPVHHIHARERTVMGLFPGVADARLAIRELIADGFASHTISLLVNDHAQRFSRHVEGSTHAGGGSDDTHGIRDIVRDLVDAISPRHLDNIGGLGSVLVSGPLRERLTGEGTSIGDNRVSRFELIEAFADMGVPEARAELYAEGVRRGGALVAIEIPSTRVDRAVALLDRHHPVDLDQAGHRWRDSGWSRFERDASPLGAEHLESERRHHDQSRQQTPPTSHAQRAGTYHLRSSVPPGDRPFDADRYARIEPEFRRHFEHNFLGRSHDALYTHYDSGLGDAYRLGYQWGSDDRYQTSDWDTLEPSIRTEWDSHYHHRGAWDRVKDAVRHAWYRVRN